MRAARRKGLTYSAALHLLFLALIIFGLPELMPPPPEEPTAITVEILPIAKISNVKPSEPAPTPAKPAPVQTAEAVPPPPPPKVEEKKPEPKKEEKKPEPKKEEKKKPKEEDLSKLLNDIKKETDKEKSQEKKPAANTPPAKSTAYNAALPMTLSEQDAVMSQIAKCWSPPIGAKDAGNLAVLVDADYNPDGSLAGAPTLPSAGMARYNSDAFYRAAADQAILAVRECTPLKGLPADKYQTWRSMELNFDPKFMLN